MSTAYRLDAHSAYVWMVTLYKKVLCHSCSQSFWWQMFCCSWTTYLEQLTCQSARQGSQLHAQNSENNWKHSCFRRTAAHRDFWLLRLINTLTYLLTYLQKIFYRLKHLILNLNLTLCLDSIRRIWVNSYANVYDYCQILRLKNMSCLL